MTQKSDVKEQAKDILEETLDREAVIVLARISEEMQLIFQAHPEPAMDMVKVIVTGFSWRMVSRNSSLTTGSKPLKSIVVQGVSMSSTSRKRCCRIWECSGL